jgi:hypothetical protein
MMYSRAERVYSKHYFASKSFAAVRKAISNSYPDEEVPNKTTILTGNKILGHSKCLSVTNANRETKQLKLRPCRFQTIVTGFIILW